MTPLCKFLNARRATTNCTHLSMAGGKYAIVDDELPILYDLLENEPAPKHYLETHVGRTAGPLLIDLDFEYPDEPRFHTRQYTVAEVDKFVESIHEAVVHFFGPQEEIEYVVSEKPTPTVEAGKRVKDGFHVLGRSLILSYKDQLQLRLYVLEKHFLQSSFDTTHVKNDMASVYDKSVIETGNWFMLGCSKPSRDPYVPTWSYLVDEDEVVRRKAVEYSVADLSIRTPEKALLVLPESLTELADLSEVKKGRTKRQTTTVVRSVEENVLQDSVSDVGRSVVPLSDVTGGRPSFLQTFDALTKLVHLWSPTRAADYAGWRNCIFCIATCAKQCGAVEAGLALAHAFVLKTPGAEHYDPTKVDAVFHGEKRGTLGFVVAHQWARSDNLTAYMANGFSVWWKTPWAHFTVAREFYGFFPDTFLLVSGVWYVYNGVSWTPDSDSAKGDSKTIKKWLSTKFFDTLYDQLKTQRDTMEEEDYQKKFGLLTRLYNKSFKNDVLSELGQFYSATGVRFNQRPELLAFQNRVFDLNACDWIEPSPDMYISMTVGYDYEEVEYSEVEAMEAWVGELFDSREKTEYVLKVLASCLYRNNREERAHFLLGRGRNGKGTLKEMMSAALGFYAGKMDLSYFTQSDKHCGAANPHLYNLKDSRVIWCDEAETDGRVVGKFSTGKLKSLTGRDKIKARPLYSGEEAEFEAGHLVALVNEMPGFTSFDFALLTRLVCVRFPYVFMPAGEFNGADPTHRLQDPRIKERVCERRMVFMAMLLRWYRRYNTEGLEVPACIRTETSAVTDELDAVGAWARGALEFKVGARTPVQIIFKAYVDAFEAEGKEHVGLEEFSKRLRRCYEVKNCRNKDDYGACNRIISYKLLG
jgi:P4 family phage/plasmid primase-like protien